MVHATRWQDPIVLGHWGMEDDFTAFVTAAGLLEFSRHPRETFQEISRQFLSTFRFEGPDNYKNSKKSKPSTPTFVIKFSMRNTRFVMSLEEFCKAIRVENMGSWDETCADTNRELVTFWRSICMNVPERLNRGKFTHIQHPALRYFALFLERGFLARDNTSSCTGPMVYLLKCAKEGTPCQYNLGVILARSLHLAVSRNITDDTPIFSGAIATLVYEHIKEERGFDDNIGTVVGGSNLLDFCLTSRMEMSERYEDHYLYFYNSSNGQRVSIRLPRTNVFDRHNEKWIVEEAQPQEEPQNQAPQGYPWGFHEPQLGGYQRQDPSFFQGGSSSGGYNYHPGY